MLQKDLLAGLTVAFVALPQCMAYALLAGVPPQYGLYAFMVASIVGSLAGSSRHLQTGPTNASSIVAASALAAYAGRDDFIAIMLLITLLAGLFQLTLGLLKLGNLTQLVSRSVLLGFISGAGVLIVANQIPNLLGLPSKGSVSVVGQIGYVVSSLGDTSSTVLALGVGTFLVALLLTKVSPKTPAGAPLLPAYLLAILGAAGAVAYFGLHEDGVRVVGNIPASLPPLSMPAFSWDLIQDVGPGAVALALIGLTEAFASAKSVASFSGDRIDTNREFIGQGVAKIAVAFLSGLPVSGSLTRSALTYQAGAVSKAAQVFSSVLLAGLLFALGPVTRYIPVASLAGILLIIAVKMVRWEHVKLAVTATRSDAVAFSATFSAALLLPLADAIYVGVGVSLALFLKRARVPRVVELVYNGKNGFSEVADADERPCPEVAIVHVERAVVFRRRRFSRRQVPEGGIPPRSAGSDPAAQADGRPRCNHATRARQPERGDEAPGQTPHHLGRDSRSGGALAPSPSDRRARPRKRLRRTRHHPRVHETGARPRTRLREGEKERRFRRNIMTLQSSPQGLASPHESTVSKAV